MIKSREIYMRTPLDLKSLITRPKPKSQANLRLFCLPYAGGSSLIYRKWSDNFPENAERFKVSLSFVQRLICRYR